jgi:dihydroorotate dehydrogenase electron transfer subunit
VAGGGEVEILYKVSGRGTALLAEARPGERVHVVGPLGRGFAPPAEGVPAVLVGGGTGIASLYGLAARCASRGPVRVLLGGRTRGDLMGREDFGALDVALEVATEDGSEGRRGLVTALLEDALAAEPQSTVYACGPTPMMHRCAEIAAVAGVACQVSLENNMACGFGVCLGCAAPVRAGGFALVCRDGPVFEADDVVWEGLP